MPLFQIYVHKKSFSIIYIYVKDKKHIIYILNAFLNVEIWISNLIQQICVGYYKMQ